MRKPADGDAYRRRVEPADEQFSALLEDSAEDLYEHAPCGYLSTRPDGRIAKVNATLLSWLGLPRDDLLDGRRFSDLLADKSLVAADIGAVILPPGEGEAGGVELELKAGDGSRLPVLATSSVKRDSDGRPLLIRMTLIDARDRRAYETELLRAREEAEQERARLQKLATTLQQTLLPPALANVPGLEVSAYYHIASVDQVGGDFYDLFPLAAGTWGLFMGDVCGKGAAAAAVTSLARYTLRAAAVYDPDPAAVLDNLNTVLNHEYNGTDPRFCTVVFGLLTPDRERGGFRITLAGGGHPPALLMRADGTADILPTPGGQLIGALPDVHIATTAVHLAPGDTLLLHTDGLTEAHTGVAVTAAGAADGRYGDDALLDFARALAPTTASDTIGAVRELLDTFGAGVDDDTAVLAIHVPRSPRGEQQ